MTAMKAWLIKGRAASLDYLMEELSHTKHLQQIHISLPALHFQTVCRSSLACLLAFQNTHPVYERERLRTYSFFIFRELDSQVLYSSQRKG